MKFVKKLIQTYALNFPNLQYQKGLCSTYGLHVEYEQSYFPRMWRWLTLGDALYTVTHKNFGRGSQTS